MFAAGEFPQPAEQAIRRTLGDEQMNAMVESAKANLSDGGALLIRTATGRTTLVEAMRPYLQVDDAFNAELAQVERGPWFRVTAAGFKRA